MKNYVIINGVNSLTITGLAISKLPSISKPPLRVMTEEIDGRDGDLITDLGYGAYDKELVVGLYGNYDINEVIGFFNQEGTIVFSNEDDKYYNFKIINQIDYEALIKFRTATINLHCQPFKYPLTETPEEIITEYVEDEGEAITLNDTKIAPLTIDLKGNTTQTGTPTPSTPVNVNVVSGDNEINIVGKNLLDLTNGTYTNAEITAVVDNGEITLNGTASAISFVTIPCSSNYSVNEGEQFSISANNTATSSTSVIRLNANGTYDLSLGTINNTGVKTIQTNRPLYGNQIVIRSDSGTTLTNFKLKPQLEKGSTATTYEPYTSQNYPLYLGVENLFNDYRTTSTSIGGVTISQDSAGVKLNGTYNKASAINLWLSESNNEAYNNLTLLKANTTYTIKVSVASGSMSSSNFTCYLSSRTADSSKTFTWNYQTITSSNGEWIKTFTTDNSDIYLGAVRFNLPTSLDVTFNNAVIKIELTKGSALQYISDTPIELCKISTYQDYIYKDSGKWYLHKEIGKVVLNGSETWTIENTGTANWYYRTPGTGVATSQLEQLCNYYPNEGIYNGNTAQGIMMTGAGADIRIRYGTEDTIANYKSWLSSNNVSLYYPLTTPTNTEITNDTLINELNELESAMSYEGQTNISQVNNDLPFILSVKGIKEGSGEGIINNIGNIYAKPIIELEGTGNIGIYKNGTQYFEVDMSNDSEITIDTEKMEAYHNGVLKNRQVIGDYNKFTIDKGNNNIEITGELTKATISNYTRWL